MMLNIQLPNFLTTNIVYMQLLTPFNFEITPFRLNINYRTCGQYLPSKAHVMSYDDPLHSQK